MSNGKLVRDNIPEIILAKGEPPKTKILNDTEFGIELDRKLREELDEYLEAGDPIEAADLVETLIARLKRDGYTLEDIEELRLKKRAERGGFESRIFLFHEDGIANENHT